MQKKMFLKLDGIRGDSKSPRHFGEIEVFSVMWGGRHQHHHGSGAAGGKALISDLTVTKQMDKTSQTLMVASATGQNLGEGVLTFEDISECGSLRRSVIFKLKSILVDSYTTFETYELVETVTLSIESLEMMSS